MSPSFFSKFFSRANVNLLDKISMILIVLTTFLLPIFFVPSSFVSFEFAKSVLVVTLAIVSFCLFVIARLKDGQFFFSKNLIFLAIVILPLVYILAALMSPSFSSSFVGYGFESGTAIFILSLTILSLMVARLFSNKEQSFYLYVALLASFVVVTLFHLARFIGGASFLSFGFFNELTNNTIGKWNDVALFFGFVVVLLLVTLETLRLAKPLKWLLSLAILIALFFLAVINFFWIWVVLGIFALISLVYAMAFGNKTKTSIGGSGPTDSSTALPERKVPTVSLVVLLVSVVFILNGQTISAKLVEFFGISHLDVRPTFSATFDIGKEAIKENALFGVGPNRFAVEWLRSKPDSVNQTLFWNIDFSYGVGFVPTALTTVGIVGLAAWVFLLLMFLMTGYKVLVTPIADRSSRYLTISSFLGALYLWIFNTIYVPSTAILALTFLFTGVFVASAVREGILAIKTKDLTVKPKLNFIYIFVLVVLFLAMVSIGYLYDRKFVSSIYFQRSAVALNQKNDLASAEEFMIRAINFSNNDVYYRSLSEIYLVRISQLLNSDRKDIEAVRAEFQDLLNRSELSARQAVTVDQTNYQNWLALGRIYETVVPLNIAGAYENAKTAYTESLRRNPKSPLILSLLGRLEMIKGNRTQAIDYFKQALVQKSDYADASAFLSQLERRR